MIVSTAKKNPLEIVSDPLLQRQMAMSQYEYVDVVFTTADADTIIGYSFLKPENDQDVRWIDVTPQTVYSSGTETPATVYKSNMPERKLFGRNYIVLRATVANYATRLLLFTERT